MPPDGWDLAAVVQIAQMPTVGMTEKQATEYFHWRTKTAWVDGTKRDVARTHQALVSDMIHWRAMEPNRTAGGGRPGQRKESPRELQSRIDAAMIEREKLPVASARTPEQAQRARELTTRIQGWKRDIAGG